MTNDSTRAHVSERSERLKAALSGDAACASTVKELALGPSACLDQLCEAALLALSTDDHRSLLELLRSGLDIHQRFQGGTPLLTLAAKAGRSDCLSMLLERGADATLRDEFTGSTPAHFAAHNGHAGCLRLLAQNASPLDEPCRSGGQTPLAQAAARCQLDCIRFLIARGARLDTRNFAGEPIAFDCFKSRDPDSLDCARALYEAGAPLNARDGKGRTALRALADTAAGADGSALPFAQLLLGLGADPNLSDPKGDAPLHACARTGDSSLAKALLAAGACASQADSRGLLPHQIAQRSLAKASNSAEPTDLASILLSAHEQRDIQNIIRDGFHSPRAPRL